MLLQSSLPLRPGFVSRLQRDPIIDAQHLGGDFRLDGSDADDVQSSWRLRFKARAQFIYRELGIELKLEHFLAADDAQAQRQGKDQTWFRIEPAGAMEGQGG